MSALCLSLLLACQPVVFARGKVHHATIPEAWEKLRLLM